MTALGARRLAERDEELRCVAIADRGERSGQGSGRVDRRRSPSTEAGTAITQASAVELRAGRAQPDEPRASRRSARPATGARPRCRGSAASAWAAAVPSRDAGAGCVANVGDPARSRGGTRSAESALEISARAISASRAPAGMSRPLEEGAHALSGRRASSAPRWAEVESGRLPRGAGRTERERLPRAARHPPPARARP